ncbi:MAG: hypothetical protein IJ571_10025 [Ruminococcus sp.]|nr:hypothetical protein [Ruminococcus sp.]
MKEKYITLDLEVIKFTTEDVITASGGVNNMNNGGTGSDIPADPSAIPGLEP